MFTQCPKCQTTFRVTATTLKAAQGRVRCGRCTTVFDALTFLREQRQSSTRARPSGKAAAQNRGSGSPPQAGEPPAESPHDDSADIPESALEFHLSADELSKVFVVAPAPTLKLPVARAKPAPPRIEEETAQHEIVDIDAESGASVEVITLEGASIKSTGSVGDRSPGSGNAESTAAVRTPIVESRRETAARVDAEVTREIEAAFAADPTSQADFTLPSGKRFTLNRGSAEPQADEVLAPARKIGGIAASRWIAGSTVLGLLLIVQLVHVNRQSLVRSTLFGPPLGVIYASLGTELSPAWDLSAYELRQWGAAADPGSSGTLRVRASVLNGADHAQPYPLLRLTLQDRFGGRVGLRDLEPREYLQGEPGRDQLLGAGQRIDAEIAIIDPGKDAVGFEIDVCLRDNARVTCAAERGGSSG